MTDRTPNLPQEIKDKINKVCKGPLTPEEQAVTALLTHYVATGEDPIEFAIVLDHTHLAFNAVCKNSETLTWMRKYMDDNPFGCQSISGICGTSFIATFFNEKDLLAKANELFAATDEYVTYERVKYDMAVQMECPPQLAGARNPYIDDSWKQDLRMLVGKRHGCPLGDVFTGRANDTSKE